jgi:hypothetical protein
MTLSDVQFPVALSWARQYALVFDADLSARLQQVQSEHGDPRHVPVPAPLTDGRFMLNADILTECVPGGILWAGFSHLDAGRFDEIAVVPLAEALALLPAGE